MIVTALALVLAAAGALAQSAPQSPAAPEPQAEASPAPVVSKAQPAVTSPQVVKEVRPRYTDEARRRRIEGVVMLEAVVRTDGRISEARIVRSLDKKFGLDEAAIEAVKQWRFKPGKLAGKPVPVQVYIELTFQVQ